MQTKNDYDRDVYNGDVGYVIAIDDKAKQLVVRFEDREVIYEDEHLESLTLAYAVSIHKSQGSEYPVVIIPWVKQHAMMLNRNLLYTAVTRGRKLVVLVADPAAIRLSLIEERKEERNTGLGGWLCEAALSKGLGRA